MEGGNLDGARGSGNMVQTDAMYQVTITVPKPTFFVQKLEFRTY